MFAKYNSVFREFRVFALMKRLIEQLWKQNRKFPNYTTAFELSDCAMTPLRQEHRKFFADEIKNTLNITSSQMQKRNPQPSSFLVQQHSSCWRKVSACECSRWNKTSATYTERDRTSKVSVLNALNSTLYGGSIQVVAFITTRLWIPCCWDLVRKNWIL